MKALFFCILPAVIFTFAYDVILSLGQLFMMAFIQNGSQDAYILLTANESSLETALIGISLIISVWIVRRPLYEQYSTMKLTGDFAGSFPGREGIFKRLSFTDYTAMAFGCISLSMVLNILIGSIGAEYSDSVFGQGSYSETISSGVILSVIVYVLVSPLIEETVFRFMLYGRLRAFFRSVSGNEKETGKAIFRAVLFSSLIFGIYHSDLWQGVYAALMGTVFALSLEYSGNILVPVILHSGANAAAIALSAALPASNAAGLSAQQYRVSLMGVGLGILAASCVTLWFSVKKRRM